MTTLNDNIVNNLFETANAIDGERYLPNADEYVPDAIERVIAHALTSEREQELRDDVEEGCREYFEESGFERGHDAAQEYIYSEHIVIDDEYVSDRIPRNWNFAGKSRDVVMGRVRTHLEEGIDQFVEDVIQRVVFESIQDNV